MLFFVANKPFARLLKWMTITEHFPWPPEFVLHGFLKSHEKTVHRGKSLKGRFCALSKLIYFKTALRTGKLFHGDAHT